GAFNAALEALPPTLADTLKGWLKAHPKALARNYNNPAGPASRDPRPDVEPVRGALPGGRVRDEGESSREALRRRSAERREQAARAAATPMTRSGRPRPGSAWAGEAEGRAWRLKPVKGDEHRRGTYQLVGKILLAISRSVAPARCEAPRGLRSGKRRR
ncbi:MAG: hypothetical protein QXD46_06905, partial [Thermofilum sp.]